MFPDREIRAISLHVMPASAALDLRLEDEFCTRVTTWNSPVQESSPLSWDKPALGFVFEGESLLSGPSGNFLLKSGMFFSAPVGWRISGGVGFAVSGNGEIPLFVLGGPIEASGRLRYIDGCRDSLVLPPVVRGAACLNALYFPAGTDQSIHTHPSVRVGLVVRGGGWCKSADGSRVPLAPGNLFVLPPNTIHGFVSNDEGMTVIAYHPDSDTGPTDQDHPMINRTVVGGISASKLPSIQTQQ